MLYFNIQSDITQSGLSIVHRGDLPRGKRLDFDRGPPVKTGLLFPRIISRLPEGGGFIESGYGQCAVKWRLVASAVLRPLPVLDPNGRR